MNDKQIDEHVKASLSITLYHGTSSSLEIPLLYVHAIVNLYMKDGKFYIFLKF